jgi:hypothetical protein
MTDAREHAKACHASMGMPPQANSNNVPCGARSTSAHAADVLTSTGGFQKSAMSGGTAPAAAMIIVIWFAAGDKLQPYMLVSCTRVRTHHSPKGYRVSPRSLFSALQPTAMQ